MSRNLPTSAQGVLLAIDVGGTKTQIASYDTATGKLHRDRLDTHAAELTGRAALQRLIAAAKRCAASEGNGPLLGVAAVFPGVVRERHLRMAPNTPGLEGIDLHGELAAAFDTTAITLDNDVKAGALAEHAWGGLRGTDHALYLNIGTGLAAAAIINGEVYRGRNGAALEIGYQLTPFLDQHAPEQWRGWREGVAPMEAVFSGASLDALAQQMLGSDQRAKDLFRSTEPHVQRELQRRLHALAAQLVNLSIAFDVERIAIGGGVNQQYPVLEQNLAQSLQRLVPFPPTLVSARFADDAPLWGALELARRATDLPALPSSIFDTSMGEAPDAVSQPSAGAREAKQHL
ncbi:glucokinase [Dyella sp. OK004]|uniref:ROK family protein n=1 Tax=Dyella sp. OK004 TaxID=1855292 RepID=UPI0008E0B5F5|nr:ROK family protein [Dyella sp. OK004]SFR86288.1 glucokinase [Dyella sp. OK004]